MPMIRALRPHRPIGVRHRRRTSSRSDARGFTLVEVTITTVLMSIIGGVIVAAMITSLRAADATDATARDASDSALLGAYLTRDAQAAGGIDPTTAALDTTIGVSTTDDDTGWANCRQDGSLVVRFSWLDRTANAASRVAVTYALSPDGSVVRRTCDQRSTPTDLVLAESVTAATGTCAPVASCTGLPVSVSMTVRGTSSASGTPWSYTVSASLRAQSMATPTGANSVNVPLLLLGRTTCPVLSLTGPGPLHVVGDSLVNSGCGATPISGTASLLRPTGLVAMPTTMTDPFAALAAPSGTCSVSGTNPTLGSSTGPDAVTVYHQPVSITGAVAFQAGRHTFCQGVIVTGTGQVTGTGVLWYVPSGGVSVVAPGTLDVTPATSGPYANLSIWSAGSTAVTIANGAAVSTVRGTLYAPMAPVTITSVSGVALGGVIADRLTTLGAGATRVGGAPPTLTAAAGNLPAATANVAYTATAPVVSGGTAPYTYTATGLPTGLTMTAAGAITGTTTATGAATVTFIAVDATGASITFTRTLDVTGVPAPAGCPATTTGWWGQYWNNNSLTGTPAFCRADQLIDFDWAGGTPDPRIPVDNFSVRWTGAFTFAAGTYTFSAGSDDGVRVWIDGAPVWNNWIVRSHTTDRFNVTLAAGMRTIVVEYNEFAGAASASLSWATAPSANCPATITGWRGEYFAGTTPTGTPLMCRNDPAINFFWGGGSPAVGVPADNFSARWTRTQDFVAGNYTFRVGSDDGVRLTIDGTRVLDRWGDRSHGIDTITVPLTEGPHTIVMEWYERGGAASAELSWTVTAPPGTPVVTAIPEDGSALVRWTEISSGQAPTSSTTVNAFGVDGSASTCTATAPARECRLPGLRNGIRYGVNVQSVNANGTSQTGTAAVVPIPAVLLGVSAQLWLDALDPDADGNIEGLAEICDPTAVTQCATNSRLLRWEDRSGRNRDATPPSTAGAPTYVDDPTANGRAINFDANGWLQTDIPVSPDLSLFVVARSDTDPSNTWGWIASSRQAGGLIIHPWPGRRSIGLYLVNNELPHTYVDERAPIGSFTAPHLYDLSVAGTGPVTVNGGVDGHPTPQSTVLDNTRTAGTITLYLGADDPRALAGRLGNGRYHEVIAFDRALSTAERRTVQEYLARKWNLPITPSAPQTPSATAGTSAATVSWTAPEWNGGSSITGYAVVAQPGGASCTVASSATSCTISGLSANTNYTFTITATNAIGTGPTATAVASTSADWAPSSLAAGRLTWWFDASNGGTTTGVWSSAGLRVTGAAGSDVVRSDRAIVERVDVLAPGSGYGTETAVTFSGGGTGATQARGVATRSGGGLFGVDVTSRGALYTSEPTVTVTGNGTGAVLRAEIVAPVTPGTVLRIAGSDYVVVERDGLDIRLDRPLVAAAANVVPQRYRIVDWTDLTGTAVATTSATAAAQPSLGRIGSRSGIVFDGINDLMHVIDPTRHPTGFDQTGTWTVLVAFQPERQIAGGAVSQGPDGWNSRVVASSTATSSDWSSPETIDVYASASTPGTGGPVEIQVQTGDGTDTSNWTRVSFGSALTPAVQARWGATGTIAEVILVNGGLSPTELADAATYLRRKWSTPAATPFAPTSVRTASAGTGQLTVSWRAPKGSGLPITSTEVRATAAGQPTVACATSAGTSCTLTGLTSGVAYDVTVTASNSGGAGRPSIVRTGVAP
jgi:type II secretory pathway pseudopilin PulG